MKQLTVTAANGVPFLVLYLEPGEYGAYPAAKDLDKPLVEFYDTRYDFTPYGQFTGGRYHVETLLERQPGVGLDLYGGESDWTVDAASMSDVVAFLREAMGVPA